MDNLIFILIDKLAYKQIPIYWDRQNLVPTMNKLAQAGIFCSNYFSQGCVTSFSMPSFFSSSFPLDYGGYDDGILTRPTVLMEVLKENGYDTVALVPTAFGRVEGYDRGFDKYFSLCDIDLRWRQVPYLCNYYDKSIDKEKEKSLFYETIQKIIIKHYTTIIEYCEEKIDEKKDSFYKRSRIFNHDFETIKLLLAGHLRKATEAPKDYIDNNFEEIKKSTNIEKFLNIPRRSFYNFLPMAIKKKIDIGNSYFKLNIWEKNAPAGFVTDIAIRWIEQHRKKPFAMFLHYNNVHEQEFADGLFQIKLDRKIYNANKKLYKNKRKYYYDLAANYTDKCVKRLLDALERLGDLDKTYIVVTSDHGDIPTYPSSPFPLPKLPGGAFKDDYYHVPLIIWHDKLDPQLVETMHSSLDISPTLCDLLKIKQPPQFKGSSILKDTNGSEYIYAEHTHRGPSDLKNKPIYISVRSKFYKYIHKEYIYKGDENSTEIEEFYDLQKDKEETENLIKKNEYQSIISKMRKLALERIQDIRGT